MKKLIFVIAAVGCLLASCRSSKNATKDTPPVPVTEQTEVTGRAPGLTAQRNLCAKVKVSIGMGGRSVSTGGNLRMRMGEVIQVSLHDPLLGISEIGRLEISPESILVIDRYNKRYTTMSYDEINSVIASRSASATPLLLNYEAIEYHFWQQALRTDTDELQFEIPTGKNTVSLRFRLSGKNDSEDWEAHTTPSSRYEQVSTEQLLRGLSQY